jgi:hypothetical protein
LELDEILKRGLAKGAFQVLRFTPSWAGLEKEFSECYDYLIGQRTLDKRVNIHLRERTDLTLFWKGLPENLGISVKSLDVQKASQPTPTVKIVKSLRELVE